MMGVQAKHCEQQQQQLLKDKKRGKEKKASANTAANQVQEDLQIF